MEEFIREQIKEKPLNKKKIFIRLGVSALCGLVFALVACLVFALAAPFFFKDKTGVAENDSETEFVPVISVNLVTNCIQFALQLLIITYSKLLDYSLLCILSFCLRFRFCLRGNNWNKFGF